MSEAMQMQPVNPDLPSAADEIVLDEAIKSVAFVKEQAMKRATSVADGIANMLTFKVNTQADCDLAAQILLDIKARKLRINVIKGFVEKPIKSLSDAPRTGFAAQIARVEAVDIVIREEVRQFRERQRIEAERVQRELQERAEAERAAREAEAEEARALAQQRAAKAAELDAGGSRLMAIAMQKSAERAAGEADAADALARQVTAVPVVAAHRKLDGVSVRRILKFEIVDESQIPDAFWKRVLDETAIRKHGIDTDGQVPVPGIRYFHEETLAV